MPHCTPRRPHLRPRLCSALARGITALNRRVDRRTSPSPLHRVRPRIRMPAPTVTAAPRTAPRVRPVVRPQPAAPAASSARGSGGGHRGNSRRGRAVRVHATSNADNTNDSMEASKITTKGDALIQITGAVTCVRPSRPSPCLGALCTPSSGSRREPRVVQIAFRAFPRRPSPMPGKTPSRQLDRTGRSASTAHGTTTRTHRIPPNHPRVPPQHSCCATRLNELHSNTLSAWSGFASPCVEGAGLALCT